ncbi:MAG: tail fiber domain-containing protein [Bacteroidales bacterium]|nr:tail fiber domain-containing protein [Bacteroidales bacterium]
MKARIISAIIGGLNCLIIAAQVPQGVNYQALARDASNQPIAGATILVKLTILSSVSPDIIQWQEVHSPVLTNENGLFSIILGSGIRQTASAVASFSDIDWNVPDLYLRTNIVYQSVDHLMGTSKLMAVPYALTAGDISGSLNKLEVAGVTTGTDDALFEVKNKDGRTVFAVYNEGVRVYVGEGQSKAVKGGFAIGSFDESKGVQNYFVVNQDCVRVYLDDNPAKAVKGGFAIGSFDESKGTQNYLKVSADSIRMYIDDNPAKAVKGGFAIGGFDMSKAGSSSFLNVATDATGIINPSQNRMLWYPMADKNAFFVGKVLIERPDSVGVNSITTGYESRAKGNYSQAFGYRSVARGLYSTAIGKGATAHRDNSFAFGENAYAGGVGSFALGIGSKATGLGSFAIGFEGRDSINSLTGATEASGEYSMAFGMGAKSKKKGSLAVGTMSEANFEYSTAIGYQTIADNWYATAVGYKTIASGNYSSAFGYKSKAAGESSVALGRGFAEGKLSAALGSSYAPGEYSIAMGNASVAFGYTSISAGYENSAVGNFSAAFGAGTFANGPYSFVSGYGTIAEADYANAIGFWNIGFKVLPEMDITNPVFNPVFEVGNGIYPARTNAISVLRNGQVIMGTHDGQFIEDQIMYNDPPHTVYIKGRKPTVSDPYYGLFVEGNIGLRGNITPQVVNNYTIGEASSVWKAVYASGYYGNGTSAYFYSDLLPSGTRNFGNSSYRWNSAYVNTYYGNSSNNAVFAATLTPSGTRDIGSTSAFWNSLYARQLVIDGSTASREIRFTESGVYAAAVGYNYDSDYLYLYRGGNVAVKGGFLGVGTIDPKGTVHATGDLVLGLDQNNKKFVFHSRTNANGDFLNITSDDATGAWAWDKGIILTRTGQVIIGGGTPGTHKLYVTGTAYSTGGWTGSDIKWKKNITPLTEVLPEVLMLQGVTYDWRTDEYPNSGFDNATQVGLIAQDVERVFPLLVRTDTDGSKAVAYDKLSAILVEAVKEQQKEIETYRNEVSELKGEVETMKAEMEALRLLMLSAQNK